jgi:hypothetical protein
LTDQHRKLFLETLGELCAIAERLNLGDLFPELAKNKTGKAWRLSKKV